MKPIGSGEGAARARRSARRVRLRFHPQDGPGYKDPHAHRHDRRFHHPRRMSGRGSASGGERPDGPECDAGVMALTDAAPTSLPRTLARWVLGATLVVAGASHLTFARDDFRAQVPAWFPVDDDPVVLVSGLVEIGLGAALLAWGRGRVTVGFVVAVFFVAIFPGNIAQYVEGNDAFGLDTDQKRLMRLFFQPVLVAWALWATAAWRDRPRRR
jgi:uncharacterized membrane protein